MAYQTSSHLGLTYFHGPISFQFPFTEIFFSEIILIGVACGLCSFLFIEILRMIHGLSEKITFWKPLKGIVGGFLVLLTTLSSTKYLGLGLSSIEATLRGQLAQWYDFLLKMYATAVTLSFGGSGGIITPIFFIGTAFGSFLASVFHLDPMLLAALGMVGLLSGCTNTPIAASIMGMEIFGTDIAPYASIIAIISFVITGHRSVYPSQLIMLRKSDSLDIDLGKPIRELYKKHEQ